MELTTLAATSIYSAAAVGAPPAFFSATALIALARVDITLFIPNAICVKSSSLEGRPAIPSTPFGSKTEPSKNPPFITRFSFVLAKSLQIFATVGKLSCEKIAARGPL